MPVGIKEWVGYLTLKVITPISSLALALGILANQTWDMWANVVLGVIFWAWFHYVLIYLLSPLWNSMYVPTPELPTDAGIIMCKVYRSSSERVWYFQGIHGEYVNYIPGYTKSARSTLKRRRKVDFDDLDLIDEIKVSYKFIEYVYQTHFMSKAFRTGPLQYRWPLYEYTINK